MILEAIQACNFPHATSSTEPRPKMKSLLSFWKPDLDRLKTLHASAGARDMTETHPET